jgi:hypothetical protein
MSSCAGSPSTVTSLVAITSRWSWGRSMLNQVTSLPKVSVRSDRSSGVGSMVVSVV